VGTENIKQVSVDDIETLETFIDNYLTNYKYVCMTVTLNTTMTS